MAGDQAAEAAGDSQPRDRLQRHCAGAGERDDGDHRHEAGAHHAGQDNPVGLGQPGLADVVRQAGPDGGLPDPVAKADQDDAGDQSRRVLPEQEPGDGDRDRELGQLDPLKQSGTGPAVGEHPAQPGHREHG